MGEALGDRERRTPSPPPLLPARRTTWASSTQASKRPWQPTPCRRRPDRFRLVPRHRAARRLVLPGVWDLRGHESAYLGGVELAGKRVLELGPATGYLTFYMERMGAEVVAFEAGFDVSVDVLPLRGRDLPDERRKVMQETIDRNHDAWWHLHHAIRARRPSSCRGTSTTCRPTSGRSTSPWSGPSCCTCASRGGPCPRRHVGPRRPWSSPSRLQDDDRPARVQHHALLAFGRAPSHELVVDLPGGRGVDARHASASATPRRPCTASATTWPTTSPPTPWTRRCTRWSAGTNPERTPRRLPSGWLRAHPDWIRTSRACPGHARPPRSRKRRNERSGSASRSESRRRPDHGRRGSTGAKRRRGDGPGSPRTRGRR